MRTGMTRTEQPPEDIAMTWQPEMDELRRRQEMTKRMGGADKVKRQHDGGRLTVRERIAALIDQGSFHEVGKIAAARPNTARTAS